MTLGTFTDPPTGLRLSWVAVKNFRCLQHVDYIPIQSTVTVVAGQNDGGKSTLLDAIAFLLAQKMLDDDDRSNHEDAGDQIEVEGVFHAINDVESRTPITIRARRPHGGRRIAETLALVHPDLGSNPEDMTLAELRDTARRVLSNNPGGNSKAPYVEALRSWLENQPETSFEQVWVPLPRDLEVRLPKLQVFSSTTAVDPVRSIQQMARTRSQVLVQSDKYVGRLRDIEDGLVADLRDHMTFIADRIRDHCDDLDQVRIQPTFDFSQAQPTTTVEFVRNDKAVDYSKVGEGRQRKTTLATYEANLDALREMGQATNYILVYDEPDSHLDYTSQKRVANILEDQASLEHVQVVVATHSKNLIDTVPLDSVLSLRLNDYLKTEAKSLGESDHDSEIEFQSELYMSLGFSNSTFLDEKIFLAVEGPTEMMAVPILYKVVSSKSLVASGVQLVSLEGSGATKEFVKRLRTTWQKTVIILLDEDSRENWEQYLSTVGFIEGEDLFFIGEKEIEDSFTDEIWVRTLQRDFPVISGQKEWDTGDLRGPRRSNKFSRSLQDKVSSRTGTQRPSKAAFGRSVAITCAEMDYLPEIVGRCLRRLALTAG